MINVHNYNSLLWQFGYLLLLLYYTVLLGINSITIVSGGYYVYSLKFHCSAPQVHSRYYS